jgi:hypothetical protein
MQAGGAALARSPDCTTKAASLARQIDSGPPPTRVKPGFLGSEGVTPVAWSSETSDHIVTPSPRTNEKPWPTATPPAGPRDPVSISGASAYSASTRSMRSATEATFARSSSSGAVRSKLARIEPSRRSPADWLRFLAISPFIAEKTGDCVPPETSVSLLVSPHGPQGHRALHPPPRA